ncbi:uncharacterized protein HD556DRAFT_1314263 [Suillus plorans]|uniref:Uncharacterized protein n=1 Tax=Suillus plorans TaxID=116603 RepID=A0A9P7AB42_9AGAM|nr:uncharacterized protein HD556DRAFT_1314263 [Suillus plorans]KAG1785398.1 hypothetical protein HD556DRAFT_1314263 [Suillus plorans]
MFNVEAWRVNIDEGGTDTEPSMSRQIVCMLLIPMAIASTTPHFKSPLTFEPAHARTTATRSLMIWEIRAFWYRSLMIWEIYALIRVWYRSGIGIGPRRQVETCYALDRNVHATGRNPGPINTMDHFLELNKPLLQTPYILQITDLRLWNTAPYTNINWEDPALYANLPSFSELMYEDTSTWQVPDGFLQLPSAHSREELPPTPNTQVPTPDNSTFNSESSVDSRPSDIGQTQRQVLDSNTDSITTEAVATGNNSSWAARNPRQPVLTTRQGVKLTEAQKASQRIAQEQ